MRHKHPHRVRIVRIDVEDVRLPKEIGQQQIVLAAVPLATDPADAVHQPQGWPIDQRDRTNDGA